MSMYVDRPALGDAGSRGLDQGDILKGLLLPAVPGDKQFGIRNGSSWVANLTGAQVLAEEGKKLRVMMSLTRHAYAIVLSNSCDNYGGNAPLLVAPVEPYKGPQNPSIGLRGLLSDVIEAFVPKCGAEGCASLATRQKSDGGGAICDACAQKDGIETTEIATASLIRAAQKQVQTADAHERWKRGEEWLQISRLATGTANPKQFYLPANAALGFPRSVAHLPKMQPVEPTFITRCLTELGTTRVCGLATDAITHLQHTIATFFGRNPRDDHAWPSDEDLALKAIWLEDELARGTASADDYAKELEWIRQRLAPK